MVGWKRNKHLIILAASLPFIFWGTGSIGLLDRDEGVYGSIAREMAERGDWITPHFNGLRYLEKPPLYFWLTAATIKLFGPSEWAVRLWSALPTLGTAVLVWRLGQLLYGAHAGILSFIIFITGVGVFRYSRVAATDSLLVFSLALSMYGLVETLLSQTSQARVSRWKPLLLYVGLALGVLSKGLIGIVFPVAILICYLFFSGERVSLQRIHLNWGVPLFLLVALPWHLLAAWHNDEFFRFYVLDNQILRFLSQRAHIEDDVAVSSVAFLVLTFLWFFPWSLFLSATLRQGFPDLRMSHDPSAQIRLLIGLWAVIVLGFFTLSSSTLEHYFLPAIPPMSLMVGAAWSDAFRERAAPSGLKWSLIMATFGCVPLGFFLLDLSERLTPQHIFAWLAEMNVYYRILREQGREFPFSSVAPFAPLAKGLGLVLAFGLPLSLFFYWLRRTHLSFLVITGIAALLAGLVFKLVLIIEPHHSTKEISFALNAQARLEDLIVHEGSLEYSGGLPFYTGRQIYLLNGNRGDLEFGSRQPEGRGLFLNDAELARLWEGKQRVFLISQLPAPGTTRGRVSGKPLFLLGQYGSRFLYSNHGS